MKNTRNAKKLLNKVTAELVEGQELLKELKKQLKKAKGSLEIENRKLVVKTIKKAVESLVEHRELLKEEIVPLPNEP